ncbi:MAG: hypothetical protein FWF51_10590 [Chitinivibrionia bacterium]|nr:hypothetical protein [Chitinivibrionia bacterium]
MKKLNFFKYVAVFAAFFCFVLFVAGCGDDDDNKGTDPSIPKGDLSNHDGNNAPVTEENLDNFLAMFDEERQWLGGSGSSMTECGDGCRKYYDDFGSGYYIRKSVLPYSEKGEGTEQWKVSFTDTYEYHNFSNKGGLYLGGGWKYSGEYEYSWREWTYSGTIRFNGTFEGTIEYQNFKYRREYSEGSSYTQKHKSGTVKIGTFDITQKYFETVINR